MKSDVIYKVTTIILLIIIIFNSSHNRELEIESIIEEETPLGVSMDYPSKMFDDNGYVNVLNFGVIGDGINDDTVNLKKAIEFCVENDLTLFVPSNFKCLLSDDVSMFGIKRIDVSGSLIAKNEVTIEFGYNSNNAISTSYKFNATENINLLLSGASNSTITINSADKLTLQANGDDPQKEFIAYSTFNLGRIENLTLFSVGKNIGWINENRFYGGRIENLKIDGNYSHNNNIFYGTMLENFKASLVNANSNYFKDCRLEGNIEIKFDKGTYNNYFERTWFELEDQYLMGTYSEGMKIVNLGLDNGVVAAPDKYYYKSKVFDILDNYHDQEATFIKLSNGYEIKSDYSKFYESDFFKVNNPVGIRFVSDKSLFSVMVKCYDSDYKLITQEVNDSIKSIGMVYHKIGNYYWFDGANIGSRAVTNFAIYPSKKIAYYKIIVETGHRVKGEKFSEFSIIKVEQFDHDTLINRAK